MRVARLRSSALTCVLLLFLAGALALPPPARAAPQTPRFFHLTTADGLSHSFRIRTSNNDGVWNEAELAMRVVIMPPFWPTLWFRALVALVILGGVAAIAVALMRYVETLRRSEERFRTLFEQSPVGLCEADLTRHPPRLVHANPAFLRLFGRTPESISGMLVDGLLAPQSRPVLDQLCRMTASGGARHGGGDRLAGGRHWLPGAPQSCRPTGTQADRCILVVEDLTMEQALRSENEAIARKKPSRRNAVASLARSTMAWHRTWSRCACGPDCGTSYWTTLPIRCTPK